jgi:hypothetical protein
MAEIKKYIPEGMTWLRAAVSAIPCVGGAVDHLLFDKADAIRNKNIEQSLQSLSVSVDELKDKINQPWFSSEEFLQLLKKLFDSVSFETDKPKIGTLGKIVALCGTNEYVPDQKKCSVFDHIAKLSYVQMNLLRIISSIPIKKKDIKSTGLVQTVSAVWLEDIVAELNNRKSNPFWEGTIVVDQEIEILESLNMVRLVPIWGSEKAYALTSIGNLAANYINKLEQK